MLVEAVAAAVAELELAVDFDPGPVARPGVPEKSQ